MNVNINVHFSFFLHPGRNTASGSHFKGKLTFEKKNHVFFNER
jgi:hypothetical protein